MPLQDTDAYALGAKTAYDEYGVPAVERFTAALEEDDGANPKLPSDKKDVDRPVVWGNPASPGETGLAAGFGTGVGPYSGV